MVKETKKNSKSKARDVWILESQGQTKSKLAEILKMESSIHAGLEENSKAQWFSENVKTGCCESFSPCTLLYAWQTWWFYSAEIQSSPYESNFTHITKILSTQLISKIEPSSPPLPERKKPRPQAAHTSLASLRRASPAPERTAPAHSGSPPPRHRGRCTAKSPTRNEPIRDRGRWVPKTRARLLHQRGMGVQEPKALGVFFPRRPTKNEQNQNNKTTCQERCWGERSQACLPALSMTLHDFGNAATMFKGPRRLQLPKSQNPHSGFRFNWGHFGGHRLDINVCNPQPCLRWFHLLKFIPILWMDETRHQLGWMKPGINHQPH